MRVIRQVYYYHCIRMAMEDVDNPEHRKVTLLEAMLGKSLAEKRGPQPVVDVLDGTNGKAEPF